MTLDMLLFEARQLSSESTSSLVRFSILALLTTLPFNLKVVYYYVTYSHEENKPITLIFIHEYSSSTDYLGK